GPPACDGGEFTVDDFALVIADHAFGIGPDAARDVGPCRHDDPIGEGPDDAGVEGIEPPLGHGVVEFADTVPFVPGGFDAGDIVFLSLLVVAHRPVSVLSVSPFSAFFESAGLSSSCRGRCAS